MESNSCKFDLHLHSYYSDGQRSPAEVIQQCKKIGLKVISLTDHENVDGVSEATKIGKKLGIKVIPGIEFTADCRGEEHHILGYFIDYQSEKLRIFLKKWQKTKAIQIKKIVRNLQKFGFKVSFEDVVAQVRGSINRPHISRAVFKNLQENSLNEAEDQKAFFKKFLLEKPLGKGLAYAERKKPEIQEVIDLILISRGMAFWAHPLWKIKDVSRIREIRERAAVFQKFGLKGIEVGYSFHSQEQTLALHQVASDLAMYESGGSDFHGEQDTKRQIGNFQTFGIKLNFPFHLAKEQK